MVSNGYSINFPILPASFFVSESRKRGSAVKHGRSDLQERKETYRAESDVFGSLNALVFCQGSHSWTWIGRDGDIAFVERVGHRPRALASARGEECQMADCEEEERHRWRLRRHCFGCCKNPSQAVAVKKRISSRIVLQGSEVITIVETRVRRLLCNYQVAVRFISC